VFSFRGRGALLGPSLDNAVAGVLASRIVINERSGRHVPISAAAT
jgi:hypothetical protein